MASISEATALLQGAIDAERRSIDDARAVVEDLRRRMEKEREEQTLQISRLRQEVEKERAALEQEKAFIMAMHKPSDDLISINAGGKVFETRRGVVCTVSDSVLAKMFNGQWDKGLKRDKDGNFFVDASPAVFEAVLSFFRALAFGADATVLERPKVSEELRSEFHAFAEYMMLQELVNCPLSFKGALLRHLSLTAVSDKDLTVTCDDTRADASVCSAMPVQRGVPISAVVSYSGHHLQIGLISKSVLPTWTGCRFWHREKGKLSWGLDSAAGSNHAFGSTLKAIRNALPSFVDKESRITLMVKGCDLLLAVDGKLVGKLANNLPLDDDLYFMVVFGQCKGKVTLVPSLTEHSALLLSKRG